MRRLTPLVLTAALLLTGCASPAAPTPTTGPSEPPAAEERTKVDWSTLPADYQRIVDEDTAAGDCEALQDMFDAAPDNVDLLNYLDEALELAGCY